MEKENVLEIEFQKSLGYVGLEGYKMQIRNER